MQDVGDCGADEKWLEGESMWLSGELKVDMQLIFKEYSSTLEKG